MADAYSILGVSPDASDAEISKAYKKLAKKYHPDLNPGSKTAAQKMGEINKAYDDVKAMRNGTYKATAGSEYNRSSYSSGASYRSYEDPFGFYNNANQYDESAHQGYSQYSYSFHLGRVVFSMIVAFIVFRLFILLMGNMIPGSNYMFGNNYSENGSNYSYSSGEMQGPDSFGQNPFGSYFSSEPNTD